MDEATFKSLQAVIEYLYNDEQRHWEEVGKPMKHIFMDVRQLRGWSAEVAKDYKTDVNVAGIPNALEILFESLPEKDKRRE